MMLHWLAANLVRALMRYVDGVPCLACRSSGIGLVEVKGREPFKAVWCAVCGGRGWVVTCVPIGTAEGQNDDDGA